MFKASHHVWLSAPEASALAAYRPGIEAAIIQYACGDNYQIPLQVMDELAAKFPATSPPVAPAPIPSNPLPAPPTVFDLVNNFAKALSLWASAGFPVVPEPIYKERLAQCRGCDYWKDENRFGLGECSHPSCGCTKIKLWIATEKCPIDKW